MQLFLHHPSKKTNTNTIYERAFKNATELYIVTAYLTDWNANLELNPNCTSFRVIIGKDFGITRKAACNSLLKWLPAERKNEFMVADQITGFHPKAIFWQEGGKYYTLIGSSNLTKAAFESNYEANIFSEITLDYFNEAKHWINDITNQSVIVSEDWIDNYTEGKRNPNPKPSKNPNFNTVIAMPLPKPEGMMEQIKIRRIQLKKHSKVRSALHHLINSCASGSISSSDFYQQLPSVWSVTVGNRLQGSGWERLGKKSDFQELSKSFLAVYNAKDFNRDDVVVKEINRLGKIKQPTRKAFFSEMLCLEFPDKYPVLNDPVKKYIKSINFKPPMNSSEGSTYLDLAKKLRLSIKANINYPAKNLAELDTVIWLAFKDE